MSSRPDLEPNQYISLAPIVGGDIGAAVALAAGAGAHSTGALGLRNPH